MTHLLAPAARYDRAAIMRDAHKRYRDGKRLGLGWSFGRCLSTAWQAAKMRRDESQLWRKIKISVSGNESFEAWRESVHDDLVLATAMAVWQAEHKPESVRLFDSDRWSV
jgi:hypothetical protein